MILAGGVYVPSEIANLNGAEPASQNGANGKEKPSLPPIVPGLARFTKRQFDVLQLHLAAIYRGLNARNRTEAVAGASKLRL